MTEGPPHPHLSTLALQARSRLQDQDNERTDKPDVAIQYLYSVI
jgi:hypothetical protein